MLPACLNFHSGFYASLSCFATASLLASKVNQFLVLANFQCHISSNPTCCTSFVLVSPLRLSDTVMAAAPLVWINGFPGSGKLTVATTLIEWMGKEKMILIDNHQLIDPVEAEFPRDHPDYQRERQLQRNTAFTKYVANASTRSQIIVFTGKMTLALYSIPFSLAFKSLLNLD